MNQRHQDLADHVISVFRDGLDETARACVGDRGFKQLHALIREALAEELKVTSGRLEELLRELRSEVDRPDLGL
jgi:hypothetical protein